jgi:DNA-binding CsgD family transcriptional regulator
MEVRRAALASRSAAERAAVAAIAEVRRDRLELLEMEALPLLRGIADGTLDPSDGAVRQRCAEEEAAELRAAIRAVAAGEDWVSPRLAYIFATDDAVDRPTLSAQETRTLRLYATGLPIKSVARRLGIGEETAKQYVRRVREKYAQANRAAPTKVDLYHRAVEDGHLPSAPSE